MSGFALFLALAAIVFALVAIAKAGNAAREVRALSARLRDTEVQLRNALRRLARYDAEDASVPTDVDPDLDAEHSARAEELLAAAAHLADEAAAARAERDETYARREPLVPPPLPARRDRDVETVDVQPVVPRVREWIRKLGPNDPNMGWEMALGTYWLPRIGALALAAAIVFLLSLAFQKWGAEVRVGLGYLVSASLLGTGWWLDRRYPNYARVLSAAGLALTYFVTFATYFVPFAKIFDTPYLTLAGLAGIVGVWAALAQRRKSQILAGITLALGHFTIALTTYSVDSPGPYTVAGIVFLSVGGAYFLARNGWFVVASLGMLASYANHFYLMTQVESSGTPFEFAVGLGILSTYFVVYTGAELIAPDAVRRERILFWFRNALAVVNTLAFLFLGTLLMSGYDFAEDQQHLFRYGLAIALLVVAVVYLRVREGDPLHNTYFVKGISAATFGLATQFDAHTLSTGLAIEMALLLFAAQRSGLVVTRLMAYGVGLLAFAHGLYTVFDIDVPALGDPGFVALAVQAAVMLVAFQFASWLYRYTDWSSRSPSRTIFKDETNALLWQLDLFAAPPEGFPGKKPLGGLLYAYGFAAMGAVLGGVYAMRLFADENGFPVLAALSLLFVVLAVPLRMRPFGLTALVMFGYAAFGYWIGDTEFPTAKAVPAIVMLGLVAFATEARYLGDREGLALFRKRPVPYALYGFVAFLTALHIEAVIESDISAIVALGIGVLAAGAAAIALHRRALAWCATGLLIWAQMHWIVIHSDDASGLFLALAWGLIALGVVGERHFSALKVPVAGPVALSASAATFALYVLAESAPGWVAVCGASGALALLAFAGITRGRTAAVLGLLGLMFASAHQVSVALDGAPRTLPLVAGFVAPAIVWIAVERAGRMLAARFGIAQGVQPALYACPAIATALLVLMLFKLPLATTYYLTLSWTGLGVVLFVLAVSFKEKVYRYCGFAALGLATGRAAFIDTRELDALPRVFALGGLGLVLLALGYAYARVRANTAASPASKEE